MKQLEIQKYLRTGGTFEDLLAHTSIKTRRGVQHPNLVLFKYDQIASDFNLPIVRECRGIVLDENDNWRAVCRAFDKFFNVGEGLAAEIDWSTARVQEKVDGSLCTIYHYKGEWHVATTGSPDAAGNVYGTSFTFAGLFWDTFESYDNLLKEPAQHFNISFELMTPHNRVVIPHLSPKLTMLAARHVETGRQMRPQEMREHLRPIGAGSRYIPVVEEFPLSSYKDIAETFETLSPLKQEGFVVVDANFNRVKVKHPGYVALHHAKDGMTTKAFIHIARTGEVSEVIAAFPEFKPLLDDAKERYEKLVAEVEADMLRIPVGLTQKDFAIEAVKTRCSAALFQLRSGRASSVREFFKTFRIENLVMLLGYKAESEEKVTDDA